MKKVTLFSVAATAKAIMVAKEDFSAISKTYDERVSQFFMPKIRGDSTIPLLTPVISQETLSLMNHTPAILILISATSERL